MADMRTTISLQAADLVAYEFVKSAPTFLTGGTLRPALVQLLRIDPHAFLAKIDQDHLQWQVEGARAIRAEIEKEVSAERATPDAPPAERPLNGLS